MTVYIVIVPSIGTVYGVFSDRAKADRMASGYRGAVVSSYVVDEIEVLDCKYCQTNSVGDCGQH